MASVAQARLVGRRIQRREDPKYLTGRARYLDDIELPHMLHAAFVRSPHAHAEICGIDPTAALALDGIHAVITGADLRAACDGSLAMTVTLRREEVRTSIQPVLPVDRARFVGEPVAIVVGESRYIAEDGVDLVDVDWRPLPAVASAQEALDEDAPVLQETVPGNNYAHIEYEQGDVEAAFEHAAHVFAKHFEVGRWIANPLEPRGVIASYEPATDEAEIWTSTQFPHTVRAFAATLTGIPEGRLRCYAPDVGGGFGLKGAIFPEEPALLVASKIVGRPLKWMEDRVEHLAAASHAKQMTVDLEIAVDEQGRFLAFAAHFLGDAGAYAQGPATPLIDVLMAGAMLPSLYDPQAVRYTLDCALTNKCPAGAARGIGWSSIQMVRETLIDEIACALELDPAELRIRNCLSPAATKILTGLSFDGGSYAEAIRQVLELADYEELRRRQVALREQGRYLGIGVSPFVEAAMYGTIHARAAGLGGATYDTGSVTVEADGSVLVRTGFVSQGQGHQTTFAQVAADALAVPLESVRIIQGDTDATTFGLGTFGSRSAVIAAELIGLAAGDLRDKLSACAAHLLGCAASEIELADGLLSVRGDQKRAMSLRELAGAIYHGGPEARPHGLDPVMSSTRFYDPPETYSNGVALALVEVDVDTGLVSVQHLWFVEDCGVMLNPMIVEGQLAGGAAQGLGMALLEEVVYDGDGQLLSGTLMDYLYPSAAEVPDMTFAHIETPAPDIASGVKGAGEGSAIATPAAVLQAVADALAPFGARVTCSPLRPDRVLALLDSAGAV